MKQTAQIFFIVFLLFGVSSLSAQKIEPINYYSLKQSKSMTELVAQAMEEGKTPVLYFTATWCGPCKHFNKTFSKGVMKRTLAEVMLIKVDVDTDAESFAQKYGVRNVPTFLLVDEDLNETGKMIGFGDSDEAAAIALNLRGFINGVDPKTLIR